MEPEFFIDCQNGRFSVGGANTIGAGDTKVEVEAKSASLSREWKDGGNGYEWLNLQGLSFGGVPCGLAMCFHHGRLREASWSASLPGAELEGGWPTRKSIDEEIDFVRKTLKQQVRRDFQTGIEGFPWGTMWSHFNAKGFLASNGLRYS